MWVINNDSHFINKTKMESIKTFNLEFEMHPIFHILKSKI